MSRDVQRGYSAKYRATGGNRRTRLKRLFGLTEEQYDALHAEQNGVCAICKKPEVEGPNFSRRLSVDHCHASGRVRGLLCRICNVGLGNFKDDPAALRNAAEYVEKHR